MTLRYPSRKNLRNTAEVETRNYHWLLVAILLAFGGGYLAGRNERTVIVSKGISAKLSQVLLGHDNEKSVAELLGLLSKSRYRSEARFIEEYGEYYGRIFDQGMIDHVFVAGEESKDRLRRRIVAKVVQKLINPNEEVSFVWATGGDSSAAGHGNLRSQTYTAILEDTVKDAFEAVGIDFVTRNYGMSWYGSGPELALCMEAVYGSDLDIIHWDFAALDGQKDHRIALWGERAAVHPSKPILFMMDSKMSSRYDIFSRFEEQGMGTVFVDKMAMDVLRTRIPGDENAALPPAIDKFICNGAVEGNIQCEDPIRFFTCEQDDAETCSRHKYNTGKDCDYGAYQKTWHPGWKENLLRGRLMGHFMLKIVEEALLLYDNIKNPAGSIVSLDASTIQEILERKAASEASMIHNAPIFTNFPKLDNATTTELTTLFRGNAICHTALLPSETRFRGIVTETWNHGNPIEGYDKGFDKVLLPKSIKDAVMPLVFESTDRSRCTDLKIDHKDFFYLRDTDETLSTIVPNNAEVRSYRTVDAVEGYIMVCLRICPLKRCSDDYVGFGESSKFRGTIDIKVDGRPATRKRHVDGSCYLLEHENGFRWGAGQDGSGQYRIDFRLDVPPKGIEKNVKISSIIVV